MSTATAGFGAPTRYSRAHTGHHGLHSELGGGCALIYRGLTLDLCRQTVRVGDPLGQMSVDCPTGRDAVPNCHSRVGMRVPITPLRYARCLENWVFNCLDIDSTWCRGECVTTEQLLLRLLQLLQLLQLLLLPPLLSITQLLPSIAASCSTACWPPPQPPCRA